MVRLNIDCLPPMRFSASTVAPLIASLLLLATALPAAAQDASNGYRLWNFTNTIKGTAQNCASCHGSNPNTPPNAMLVGVNIGMACGSAWPMGTAHALKTLCVIGNGATQAQAFTITNGAISGVPLMAQFNAPLSAAERQDLAAFLLASYVGTPVPFARPEFQQDGSTSAITSLDLGNVNDGATATRTLYFANTGTGPMAIASNFVVATAITGLNATRFTASSTVPAGVTACAPSLSLAAGARCGISITFSPDLTVGGGALQTATLTIPSNGGSGVSQVNLNGRRAVVAAPAITLNPAGPSYSAGNAAAGSSTPMATITLTNSGTAALNFTGITIGGTNASDFTRSTAAGDCAVGTAVAAGGSCTLRFTFAPPVGSSGGRSASVSIASNAAGSPLQLTLSGTVGTVAPTIGFGTSSNTNQAFLRLQSNAVGTAVSGVVTVRNLSSTGGPSLNITNVQLSAGGPTFAITPGATNCLSAPVAPGGSCTINVSYTPPNMQVPHTGNIVITSDGVIGGVSPLPGPHNVVLEGTVATAGSGNTTAVAPDARPLRFANTPVNQTSSQTERITVTNTGSAALTVQARLGAGTQSDFTVVNGCASVAVGNNCFVDVQFRPRGEGARSDSLTLTYNGGSLPVMALSGTGQAAAAAGQGSGGGALSWPLLALLGVACWLGGTLRRRTVR